MSHRALSQQFESFASDPKWADPKGAEGQCYDASSAFARHIGAKIAHYTNPRNAVLSEWARHDMENEEGGLGHVAVHVGGHVVDWTARQFWPDAPHPLVESRSDYSKRFERFETEDHP